MSATEVMKSDIRWPGDAPGDVALSCPIGVLAPLVSEVVVFNFGRLPRRNATRPHLHTFHQIDVVLQGHVRQEAEGLAATQLSAGDALLIAPLARHENWSKAGYVHASLKLFLAPQAARRLSGHCFVFRPRASVIALLRDVGLSMANNEAHAVEGVLAAASSLVVEALRARPQVEHALAPQDEFRRMILPILQPVDENPSAEWTVQSMADACHLSVDYFTRCFRQAMRQTPKQYLLTARMRRAAAQMVSAPQTPLKDVARRVGYSSVHTFTRAFRATVGMTPAAFRDAPRGTRISPYL